MNNNNFNSSFGNNGNESGYKPFSSSNSRQSNGFNQTPTPMSRQNNNLFGNSNQGFGNNSSFGNQSSFIGQSNNHNPFASNNRNSSFSGSNYNNNSSFGNMNNNQNPFASNNRNSSFGNSNYNNSPFSNSSFSNQRTSGFGSQYNMSSSFGQSNQRGYSLMNSPFSTRPDSMNRPISVYGKSTGFYFPRENNTVTFNEQNSQILTPPEHLEQNNYQEQYEEQQQQDYSSYDDNTYQDNQYEEQSYDQNYDGYQDQENYYNDQDQNQYNEYNEDQNTYNDEVQDPNQFTTDNAGGNLISRMARDLKELEMQSNANIPRGVILATREGDIIGQGYNYVDENNDEYEGEEYAIIGDLAEGGAANCVIYATSAPNKKVHDLILASGVKEVLIVASDSKERKQLSKDKDYKKSEKALTKKGINVEIIVDGE